MSADVPGPTDDSVVDDVIASAAAAFTRTAQSTPAERANWLAAAADALDQHSDELVAIAHRETHLPAATRLAGELARTTFQLRLFGQVLRDGAFLGATVDHADPDWPMGARPDLRRMLVAIGPVLVFAASNFPFAFSVAGGDSAAALAAGCPVVVKAHPGHPELSARVGEIVNSALVESGAPTGTFAVIYGQDAGVHALRHPQIQAAAFTGSVAGGRALFDIAAARPRPIPFYGELGSINPVVVTRAALAGRGHQIVEGFVSSFTLGCGQFCTKPGLVFVPDDADIDAELATAVSDVAPTPMLNESIYQGFSARMAQLSDGDGSRIVQATGGSQDAPAASLFRLTAQQLLDDHANYGTEAFGPASVLVGYRDFDELARLLDVVEPSLTASIQAEESDAAELRPVIDRLVFLAGRVLWNQWPTGVTVSWAQQHGGSYPATTAPTTTSVGTAAIERFLRPVAWQGFPDALLPAAVQESNPWSLPRRVDGQR